MSKPHHQTGLNGPVDNQQKYFHGSSQDGPSLSQIHEVSEGYNQADVETQVPIEKEIAEVLLQQYFSDDRFRFRMDENQSEICLPTDAGTEHTIPQSHVALYRIERQVFSEDARKSPDEGWKLHGLLLRVHADAESAGGMVYSRFNDIMKEKTLTGELVTPGFGFGILQMGVKVSFFQYEGPGT